MPAVCSSPSPFLYLVFRCPEENFAFITLSLFDSFFKQWSAAQNWPRVAHAGSVCSSSSVVSPVGQFWREKQCPVLPWTGEFEFVFCDEVNRYDWLRRRKKEGEKVVWGSFFCALRSLRPLVPLLLPLCYLLCVTCFNFFWTTLARDWENGLSQAGRQAKWGTKLSRQWQSNGDQQSQTVSACVSLQGSKMVAWEKSAPHSSTKAFGCQGWGPSVKDNGGPDICAPISSHWRPVHYFTVLCFLSLSLSLSLSLYSLHRKCVRWEKVGGQALFYMRRSK